MEGETKHQLVLKAISRLEGEVFEIAMGGQLSIWEMNSKPGQVNVVCKCRFEKATMEIRESGFDPNKMVEVEHVVCGYVGGLVKCRYLHEHFHLCFYHGTCHACHVSFLPAVFVMLPEV